MAVRTHGRGPDVVLFHGGMGWWKHWARNVDALAERFTERVGVPPMQYLAQWRIQLAADRLRNGRDGIASIAAEVGYESEAAFNRAFKRVTGVPPGSVRKRTAENDPLAVLAGA